MEEGVGERQARAAVDRSEGLGERLLGMLLDRLTRCRRS
jgi:hypothetical protein